MSFAVLQSSARNFRRCATAIPVMNAWAATPIGLGSLGSLLGEMILRAVPKQRTSHSKKRKRMATKGLKNRKDLVPCRGCGRPKAVAHICLSCYSDIKKKLKQQKREEQEAHEL